MFQDKETFQIYRTDFESSWLRRHFDHFKNKSLSQKEEFPRREYISWKHESLSPFCLVKSIFCFSYSFFFPFELPKKEKKDKRQLSKINAERKLLRKMWADQNIMLFCVRRKKIFTDLLRIINKDILLVMWCKLKEYEFHVIRKVKNQEKKDERNIKISNS